MIDTIMKFFGFRQVKLSDLSIDKVDRAVNEVEAGARKVKAIGNAFEHRKLIHDIRHERLRSERTLDTIEALLMDTKYR